MLPCQQTEIIVEVDEKMKKITKNKTEKNI